MNYHRPRTITELDAWLKYQYPDYKAYQYTSPQKWAMYFKTIRQRESVTL